MDYINNNNNSDPLPRPTVVLLLLDGWGIAPLGEANAIASVEPPTFLNLIKEYPVAVLATSNQSLNERYLTLGLGQEKRDQDKISLSQLISEAHLAQLKITETERLAALTHFFNGGSDDRFFKEDWITVSSDGSQIKGKASSALSKITRETIKAIKSEQYQFIVASLPTLDLVARKGDLEAVKQTVILLDQSLKKILTEVTSKHGVLIVTAACGNAERMINLGTELIDSEITTNPVPVIISGEEFKGRTIGLADPVDSDLSLLEPVGTLADIAPTILNILGITKPETMSGESLL